MIDLARRFWRAESGAIAPTLALALFALVAAGGIAFDYARLASLDTELQNAADQAALAAVGQLDGDAGSRARATAAAQELVENLTYFANDQDPDGTTISIASVEFYSSYNPNRTNLEDPPGTMIDPSSTTGDQEAGYVRVTVETRRANFAFTPIVAAFGGDVSARALAGLDSAICNQPPLMMCNPAEPAGNTDSDYPFNFPPGTGIQLVADGQADAPGNFGFLETGFGTGAANLARALGYNGVPGECAAIDGVETKPGLNDVVLNALNTRFDVSTAGANTCPSGGTCSPSRNVRKDLVRGNQCGITGQGWDQSANPYRPTTAEALPADGSADPDVMGYPRDMCHAVSNDGVCGTPSHIGDGNWDRDAYFRVNYGWDHATWMTETGLGSSATRYDVYVWEMNHPLPSGSGNPGIDTPQTTGASGSERTAYSHPICRTPGITPDETTVDRRRIAAAVINCEAEGVTGGSDPAIHVAGWLDIFLVEQAFRRTRGSTVVTEGNNIYVEVIGVTPTGAGGATGGQVVRRDVPRLLE